MVKENYSRQIIDPLTIPADEYPVIVLVDNMRGIIPWMIKFHTMGRYSHVAEYWKKGKVASQDLPGYREVDIEKYMKPHMFLKFWKVHLTPAQRSEWIKIIQRDLDEKPKYDKLGILGQLLRLVFIQDSDKYYCSEMTAHHQNEISDVNLYEHLSPKASDRIFKMLDNFSVIGYWFMED